MNEVTDKMIDRDHTFCLQFAERDMNGPLIRAGGAEAIVGQIGALADAHAGVTDQQKCVTAEIIPAEELLVEELILLSGEGARQSFWEPRNVLAANQMGEFRKRLGPSQLLGDGAQLNEQVDAGRGGQRRRLRAQARHPAEDVWIAVQFIERAYLGISGAEGNDLSPVEALSRALGARQGGDSPANGQAIENDYDSQNMQFRKEVFLATQRNRQADDYLHSTRQAPLSRYEIKAGWEIPAVLEQSLNSDLPGDLKALVTSNVYDTATGLYLLIPQGSRLIGKYDSRVSYGQEGVQVAWSRIIYPDASSIDLDGMMGLDSHGNAGLRDHVDRHYRRLVGFSVLTSMFTAAFQISQRSTQSALSYPTLAQTAGAAVGQELSQTGAQIMRHNLNVQPTVKIPAGHKFTVRVNRDILFEAPYQSIDANPLPTSRRYRAGG